MNSRTYLGWTSTSNSVIERFKDESLIHTFSSKIKSIKSTKLFNKELKKFSGTTTYSEFVKRKKRILRKLAENIKITDQSDVSDDDYTLFDQDNLKTDDINELKVDNNDEFKTDLPDDCFSWLYIQKKGRKKVEFDETQQLEQKDLGFNNNITKSEAIFTSESHKLDTTKSLHKNDFINDRTENKIDTLKSENSINNPVISNSFTNTFKKVKKRKSIEHRLSRKETLNQPKDSGIDEDSREYTKISGDSKQNDKVSNGTKVVIGNINVSNKTKNDDSEQCKKQNIKIIGEKTIMKKYKIVDKKDTVQKSLIEEKNVLESEIKNKNKYSDLKNESIDNNISKNIEDIDSPSLPFVEENENEKDASNDECYNLCYYENDSIIEKVDNNLYSKEFICENVDSTQVEIHYQKALKRELEKDPSSFLTKKDNESKKIKLVNGNKEESESETNSININSKNNNTCLKIVVETDELNHSNIDQNLSKLQNVQSPIHKKNDKQKTIIEFLSNNECQHPNLNENISKKEQNLLENKKISNRNELWTENNNIGKNLILQNSEKDLTILEKNISSSIKLNEIQDESIHLNNIIPDSQESIKENKYNNNKESNDYYLSEKEDQISEAPKHFQKMKELSTLESNILEDIKKDNTLIKSNSINKNNPIIDETEESHSEDESNEITNHNNKINNDRENMYKESEDNEIKNCLLMNSEKGIYKIKNTILSKQEELNHSDNSNSFINDCCSDIDIDEQKNVNLLNYKEESNDSRYKDHIINNSPTDISEPNSPIINEFKEKKIVTNFDNQSSNINLICKSAFKVCKKTIYNRIPKIQEEDSFATLNDPLQLSKNHNSEFGENHHKVDERSSSGRFTDTHLLNSLNQNNESNNIILENCKKLNNLSKEEIDKKEEGSDSGMEMSPTATKKLFLYKRMNLLGADSSSSSEDEEAITKNKIIDETFMKNNQTVEDQYSVHKKELKKSNINKFNVLKIRAESEYNSCEENVIKKSETVDPQIIKSLNTISVNEFGESIDKIEDNVTVETHEPIESINKNNYQNNENIIINDIPKTLQPKQNNLESQEMFSSLEDLTKEINQNSLNINEEQKLNECNVTRNSQTATSLKKKKNIVEKITEISELCVKENLINCVYDSTTTFNDISEDEQIIILDISKIAVRKSLIGKKIIFSKKSLRLGKHEYEVKERKISPTLSCLQKLRKNTDHSHKIINIRPLALIAAVKKIVDNDFNMKNKGKKNKVTLKKVQKLPMLSERKRLSEITPKKKKVLKSRKLKKQQILEQEQISNSPLNLNKEINFKGTKTKENDICNDMKLESNNTTIENDLKMEKETLKRKLSLVTNSDNKIELLHDETFRSSQNLSPNCKKFKYLEKRDTDKKLKSEKNRENFVNEQNNEAVTASLSINLEISTETTCKTEEKKGKKVTHKRKCKYKNKGLPKSEFKQLKNKSITATKNIESKNQLINCINLPSKIKKKVKSKVNKTQSAIINLESKKEDQITPYNEIKQIIGKAFKSQELNFSHSSEKSFKNVPLRIKQISSKKTKCYSPTSSSDDEKEFINNSFKVRQKSNEFFKEKDIAKSSALFDSKNSSKSTIIKTIKKDRKIFFDE